MLERFYGWSVKKNATFMGRRLPFFGRRLHILEAGREADERGGQAHSLFFVMNRLRRKTSYSPERPSSSSLIRNLT